MIKKGILLLTTAIFMSSPMLSAMEKDEELPSQPVKGQKQTEQSFILSAFPVDVWLNIAQRLPVRRAHAVLNATSSELRNSKDLWRRIVEKFFPESNLTEVYKGSDNPSVNAYRNLMQMASYLFHLNRLVKAAHLMLDEQGNNKFINLINQTFKGNFAEILTARVLVYSGKTEEAFEIIQDLRERGDHYAQRWYEEVVFSNLNIYSSLCSWIPEGSILNYIQDYNLENFVGSGSRQRAMDFKSKHHKPDSFVNPVPNDIDSGIHSGDISALYGLLNIMQPYSRTDTNNANHPGASSITKFKAEQLLFMMDLVFGGTYTQADWSKDEVWVEPKKSPAYTDSHDPYSSSPYVIGADEYSIPMSPQYVSVGVDSQLRSPIRKENEVAHPLRNLDGPTVSSLINLLERDQIDHFIRLLEERKANLDQGSQSSRVYHSDDETQPQDEDNN